VTGQDKVIKQECLPCVSPHSKRQVLVGCGDSLIFVFRFIPIALTELRKPKSVEYIRVCEDSSVSVSGTRRNGDFCACWNSHAVGKCEWAQHETAQGPWEGAKGESVPHQCLTPRVHRKEPNERKVTPSNRWVSRRKLSILCILSIPAFVQPSSLITASTS